MNYPPFAGMGRYYPVHLEAQYERILARIAELWDAPELNDYLTEVMLDSRTGRQGFPLEVMGDLMRLRQFREVQTFRTAERTADALTRLRRRRVPLTDAAFLRAFAVGDKEVIGLFLRARYTLPATDEDGVPLLLAALKRGNTIVARILLNGKVDINIQDALGLTPLLVACGKPVPGYRIIAEELIARGARVNMRDALGNTPLILALRGGMFDLARRLILNGANVSARSRDGESPLGLARRHQNSPEAAEIAELLVSRHAVE